MANRKKKYKIIIIIITVRILSKKIFKSGEALSIKIEFLSNLSHYYINLSTRSYILYLYCVKLRIKNLLLNKKNKIFRHRIYIYNINIINIYILMKTTIKV